MCAAAPIGQPWWALAILSAMTTTEIIALLIPLIVIQLGLMVLALRDLLRADRRVRGGNKGIWAIVIIFGEILGPLIYLAVGRLDE
jgi:hypothetical protein